MGHARTEDELVARARAGDADAYAELVRRHQDVAFRTAMLITQHAADAEEAAQDGFVKAWDALGRFRADQPLKPWLLAIVANEARNRRRAAGRREHLALRAAEGARRAGPPSASADSALLAAELRHELLSALTALDDEDRLVLGCRYLLELSEAETAAALDVPAGTVKSRSARALERLRARMEEVRRG